MKKIKIRLLLPALLFVWGISHSEEKAEIEFKRISVAGQFDNGQVISGKTNLFELTQPNEKFQGDFFQRMGVWITQEATVKERLHLTVGVGGLFWYAMPQNPAVIASRQTQFGPGISQAQGTYTFGDLKNPAAHLQMGFFPYKYNSDSKNLGEYLLRSGTYPGNLVTGGWNMLNSAGYMTQGFRLNFSLWDGKFQSDLILAMERDLPPLFSITPAYVATVKPVKGLQVGAGVACHHCIPIKPSVESPEILENQVITGLDSVVFDTTGSTPTYTYFYARDTNSYYTFQGVKLTGSVSVDPKAYVPMKFLGPEDLKIYAEVALLGVKNYPYLYEKKQERMPIMVGLNLPTFKLLDILSLEVEYYDSKFANDFSNPLYGGVPMWNVPGADGSPITQAAYEEIASNARRDNWKWSLYAKKDITKGIQIYAQAASDHIRTMQFNGGVLPSMVPVTNRNGKDWYYLIRLQFGI